ncbi:hypothetical protein ACFQZ2_06085 [Streptomonospora algeriensis]
MSAPVRITLYVLVLAAAFAVGLGAGALAGPLMPGGPTGQSIGQGHGGSPGQP